MKTELNVKIICTEDMCSREMSYFGQEDEVHKFYCESCDIELKVRIVEEKY